MFENIFQIFGNFIIVNHLLNNLVQLLLFLTGFLQIGGRHLQVLANFFQTFIRHQSYFVESGIISHVNSLPSACVQYKFVNKNPVTMRIAAAEETNFKVRFTLLESR